LEEGSERSQLVDDGEERLALASILHILEVDHRVAVEDDQPLFRRPCHVLTLARRHEPRETFEASAWAFMPQRRSPLWPGGNRRIGVDGEHAGELTLGESGRVNR
jgi:hypothetical protein